MKKVLLSFGLMATVLLAKAQNLPYNANFNDGQPLAGWVTSVNPNALSIEPYSAIDASNNCAPNTFGLVLNPAAFNPTDRSTFTSSNLEFINSNSRVTFSFNLYAYNSAQNFNCQTQQNCSATVKVYLVNTSHTTSDLPSETEIYGQSSSVTIQTNTSANPLAAIDVDVTKAIPDNTPFRLVFDIESVTNCANPLRFVIDNLRISEIARIVTPVSFKAFTAARNKSNVSISWTTASEQNNNGFYVQRNNGDGWKNVAFVFSQAPGGNSASDLTYSYTDPNNIKGVSQYRILQVDIDGKSKFSDIRLVKGEEQLGKLIVYPNPSSTGNINVVFDGQTARDVNVTDFSGRLIRKYSSVINNLEIKGLTTGVYSILVTEKATGSKFVQKVVIK